MCLGLAVRCWSYPE